MPKPEPIQIEITVDASQAHEELEALERRIEQIAIRATRLNREIEKGEKK